ncbi:MAG TPA: DegV family protein [Dehalococcoidia bacterium]|nr:DegV family protein [Dehalococcoidia bacterium]
MAVSKVKIVTDSTACLSAEEISKYDVHVVPLKVIFGTEIYTEGVDITSEDFYRRLATRDPMPTTSQPAVSDFTRVYGELAEKGHPILSVHISSKLSGTVNSAVAARQELPRAQIEIIDCLSVALRMLIVPAVQAAARGLSLPQLKVSIGRLNSCLSTVGMLNTLEYLWRGGRIGGAKALLGTLLRIKPLLDFRNGEVKVLGRLRTSTQAMESILEIMKSRIKPGMPVHVGVAQTNASESALALSERVKATFNCAEIDLVELGPVLGTHLGPGFFGTAFYSDEEWRPDRC